MDYNQAAIDGLRAAHLCLFAAGMGAGIYCDVEKFRKLRLPMGEADVDYLARLHGFIGLMLAGLWVTGLMLVYVRTSFAVADFSPKLWLKLGLMTVILVNSWLIGRVVIPILRANVGQPLTALSPCRFMAVVQIGIMSMFFWTSGLFLGSSVVLKTAGWDLLAPLFIAWFALMTLLGQCALLMVRRGPSGEDMPQETPAT